MVEQPSTQSSDDHEAPYLSFIVCSRNDDYAGSMLTRLQTSLDALCAQLGDSGLSAEVLLIDWNPSPERPLLQDALSFPALPAGVTVRFVVVPPEIHQRYLGWEKLAVNVPVGNNIGILRARGRFVVPRASDVFYSRGLMAWLAQRELRSGHVYRCCRVDVPQQDLGPAPAPWREMVARLEASPRALVHGPLALPRYPRVAEAFENGSGDFLLASREDWLHIGGLVERDTAVSMDHDGLALHAFLGAGCEQVVLGDDCRVLKLAHASHTFDKVTGVPVPDWLSDLERRLCNRMYRGFERRGERPPDWYGEAVQFWLHLVFALPRRAVRGIGEVTHPPFAEFRYRAALMHAARSGSPARATQRRAWHDKLLLLTWFAPLLLVYAPRALRDLGFRALLRRIAYLVRLRQRQPVYVMNTGPWGYPDESFAEKQIRSPDGLQPRMVSER